MTAPHTIIQIAEIPADALLWIVIGVVWAVAQVITKLARRSKDDRQPERTIPRAQRDLRPVSTHEPVSPNDELRRFLREISGGVNDDEPQPNPMASRAAPASAPRPMSTPTASSAIPRPQPATPPPSRPPPPRPKPRPAVAKPVSAIKPVRKPVSVNPRLPGLGDWRTAVVHREIIGPPRAVRPYSATDF